MKQKIYRKGLMQKKKQGNSPNCYLYAVPHDEKMFWEAEEVGDL